MTMAVATASTMSDALSHLLTSVISLQGADCGRVQLFDRDTAGRCAPRCSRASSASSSSTWSRSIARETSPCAIALRTRSTNEVGDV